jgi:hypothetical protein
MKPVLFSRINVKKPAFARARNYIADWAKRLDEKSVFERETSSIRHLPPGRLLQKLRKKRL